MNMDGKGTLTSIELTDEAISRADCVAILTDHSCIDYSRVLRLARFVVDSRNVTRRLGMPEHESKIVRL
jgi:UDP-N-acetyl-D-glucosamine dehydrogenase